MVVRIPFARRMPFNPRAFIARSTDPGDAEGILRWIRAVIFRRP